MAGEEGPRGRLVRSCRRLVRAVIDVIGLPSGCCFTPVSERSRDDRRIDALLAELEHQGVLAARVGAVARLDPGGRECNVIEHPQVSQPLDRGGDQILAIPGLGQAPANLSHGSLPDLEEPQCRVKDDRRIIDLCLARPLLGE